MSISFVVIDYNEGQNHWHISAKIHFLEKVFNFSAEKNTNPKIATHASPHPQKTTKTMGSGGQNVGKKEKKA